MSEDAATKAAAESLEKLNKKKAAKTKRTHPELSDLGNAERLINMWGNDLLYCPELGWMVWDGTIWQRDAANEVMELSKKTVLAIPAEIPDAEGTERQQLVRKWALSSQSQSKLHAMVDLARSIPDIVKQQDAFDKQEWLLTCPNVTVDLKTGEMREHSREDLSTRATTVDYDPTAQCPKWTAFLTKVFPGHPHMPFFLQQASGYTLTGNVGEQCIMIPHGGGQNGKSTFLDTLVRIMGDYAAHIETSTILVGKPGGIPNDIAGLRGARLVVTGETDAGQRLSESMIKKMTSGEKMAARFLHHEFFSFYPQFKLWFSTNNKPSIRGQDEGIWRRIHLVPFEYRIPDNEKIKDFYLTFTDELPGILNWMVQGCIAWQETDGLILPEEVKKATKGYRTEMDVIGSFLDEECTVADGLSVQSSVIYKAYVGWCEENGERGLSNKGFSQRLGERGFPKKKAMNGNVWIGVDCIARQSFEQPRSYEA